MGSARTTPVVILVVEDELLVRLNASEALRDDGFEVVEAETGSQALELIDGGLQLDVLFTDVNMPGAPDGVELAEVVCARLPGTRVIVASGRPVPRRALPCDGRFLPKPYRLAEVSELVTTLMNAAPRPPGGDARPG